MGKSYRNNPIFKNAGESDKTSKQIGNRKLRGATRAALKNYDPEQDGDIVLPEPDEIYNVHNYNSEGKRYRPDHKPCFGGWERGRDKREIE